MELKKGDIVLIKNPISAIGSEIRKTRPAVVISPMQMSKYAERIIVIPLTKNIGKLYPFESLITSSPMPSKACCDQIQTMSTKRVIKKYGNISKKEILNLNNALKVILEI